ncbi:MAG: hypothetical protein CL908_12255 [Deltaproteobacteria bacterium]|nr:hypothetical protein [Deltaproteobacteria bacterium]
MSIRGATWLTSGVALMLVSGLFMIRCELGPKTSRAYDQRPQPFEPKPVLLPPPPTDSDYMPCNDCHDGEPTNQKVRLLEDEHEETQLDHGFLWCMSCHDVDDRDRLHLVDGRRVDSSESWELCTQCHGAKRADWRAGVHGKRTGNWRGPKEYLDCVTCHDPHAPRFKALAPEPPPVRPDQIRVHRPIKLWQIFFGKD